MVGSAVEEAVRDRGEHTVESQRTPTTAPATRPPARLRPPGLLELEQLLAEHLDTRVSVAMNRSKGRIVVEFADLADLERIYRRMVARPTRARGLNPLRELIRVYPQVHPHLVRIAPV